MQARFTFTYILSILMLHFHAQNPVGLYGECNNKYSGYTCQQILLDSNKHFEYFDYLHLNGKKINKGVWSSRGDTIILNSVSRPEVIYNAGLNDDNFTICIRDSVNGTIWIDQLYLNSDTIPILINDTSGIVIISKNNIKKLFLRSFPNTFILNFAIDELKGINKITIHINYNLTETVIFKDEKWLLYKEKLLYEKLMSGEFNKELGLKKTSIKNKKF